MADVTAPDEPAKDPVAHGMDCCWDCFHGRRTHDPDEECWCSEEAPGGSS